jgi:transcriptional regulator with XRE-family HTH domain
MVTGKLATLRLQAGLTQVQLAARMGTTVVTVSRWEQGHNVPPKRIRAKLARVLGVPVDRLGLPP